MPTRNVFKRGGAFYKGQRGKSLQEKQKRSRGKVTRIAPAKTGWSGTNSDYVSVGAGKKKAVGKKKGEADGKQ